MLRAFAPPPRTLGPAFLHGPARLFATVAIPDTRDDIHDEAEVEAR
ncbi:hypothetical protein SATRM34S_05387 [Streptomyces atroolivaceus]